MKRFDRAKYNMRDLGSHEMLDRWAENKLGEDWVQRVNRPGTKAGRGRWHHHQYDGVKNAVIEDTKTGKVFTRKGLRF